MSNGHVITGRGEELNMDQLIQSAKRPFNKKAEKAEIGKRPTVVERRQVNVRAYVPAAGSTPVPQVPEEIKAELNPTREEIPIPSSYAEEGEAASLADLTGIRITKLKHARVAAEGEVGMDPKSFAESQALGEIMRDLNSVAPAVAKESERISREEAKIAKMKKNKTDLETEL